MHSKTQSFILSTWAALAAAGLCCSTNAYAEPHSLQWDAPTVDYPGGSTSPVNFGDVDGSGIDVSISWSGNTDRFLTDYDIGGGTLVSFPDDDVIAGLSGLWLAMGFATENESVTATFVFSQPVTSLHIPVYDIDGVSPTFERLLIRGYDGANGVVPVQYEAGDDLITTVVPYDGGGSPDWGFEFLNGGENDVDVPPPNPNSGWVLFDDPINSLTLEYAATPDAERGMIIGDITFVPEPSTLGLLMGSLFVLGRPRRR